MKGKKADAFDFINFKVLLPILALIALIALVILFGDRAWYALSKVINL